MKFIDFEYAGWDHAAKTICDFLLPARISPVPLGLLEPAQRRNRPPHGGTPITTDVASSCCCRCTG